MFTLEEFKKAIEIIQAHEKDDEVLTKIMLKNSIGVIDYGFEIAGLCVKLLAKVMNDKDEWIEWWLYEGGKKVWANDKEYTVSTVEDLYYVILGEYDKISAK